MSANRAVDSSLNAVTVDLDAAEQNVTLDKRSRHLEYLKFFASRRSASLSDKLQEEHVVFTDKYIVTRLFAMLHHRGLFWISFGIEIILFEATHNTRDHSSTKKINEDNLRAIRDISKQTKRLFT